MAASEIPEDIRATAKAVRDKLCIDCECTFDRGCGCLDALHEALLAERRSCSVIARDAALYSGCPADFIADEIADTVLNGIRQDSPNET